MKQKLIDILNTLSTENLEKIMVAVSLLKDGQSEEEILCQILADR